MLFKTSFGDNRTPETSLSVLTPTPDLTRDSLRVLQMKIEKHSKSLKDIQSSQQQLTDLVNRIQGSLSQGGIQNLIGLNSKLRKRGELSTKATNSQVNVITNDLS